MQYPPARLRILHVIGSADAASGGPIEGIIRQEEVTRHLASRDVVALDLPSAPDTGEDPFRIYRLGEALPPLPGLGALRHYGYTSKLIPWLRENASQYDVVIVNGLWNFAALACSLTLPKANSKYFVFPHGMMDPWFKKAYPLKHLAKILFWLLVEGRLLAGAQKVFFTSEEERRLARGQFPLWRYSEQVVGYGTGVPPAASSVQRAAFQATALALGDRPYLLFLSRIHRKKGCDLLIDAFAKIAGQRPELQLVIAGPDQEGLVSVFQERARALGIADRIHWPGMLKGDAKWGAYRGAEAFILPSHQENFGIVVAEAMACGAPVLITNKVNIWREIEAAGGGLVENDDADGAESLLRRWLGMNDTQKAAMRDAALQAFKSHFDVATVAPALIQTIKSAL